MSDQIKPPAHWLEIGLLEEALEELEKISFKDPLKRSQRLEMHDAKVSAGIRIRMALKNLNKKQQAGNDAESEITHG